MESSIIQDLARNEGKKLKIKTSIDDINTQIPFFELCSDGIKVGGYKQHDNAPRMIYWAQYMVHNILPNLDRETRQQLNGFYNIELHDSYSYLETNYTDYNNCLVWSKRKYHEDDVVLLPDLYQLGNYSNKFKHVKDNILFEQKNDKIGFWGTTTGNKNPRENERIKICMHFHDIDQQHEISDCFITRIAQMKKETVLNYYPSFSNIYKPVVSINQQYNYKFLLNIPGNTCSWDRVPMIMFSNSLLLNTQCSDECFYYPLLKNNKHYVEVLEVDDIKNKRLYYLNNPNETKQIIHEANIFANQYLNANCAKEYVIQLFKECAYVNGP
jgi:hypothetical protein